MPVNTRRICSHTKTQSVLLPGYRVVAVYNLSGERVRKALEFDGNFALWEFFDGRYLGVFTDSAEVELAPKTVRIYRMTAAGDCHCVLGADFSMLCGLVSLETSIEAANLLELTATRPLGENGSVFLHAPHGWRIVKIHGAFIGLDSNNNSIVICVPFSFESQERVTKIVKFA